MRTRDESLSRDGLACGYRCSWLLPGLLAASLSACIGPGQADAGPEGAAGCDAGSLCDGRCIDLQRDISHCGGCGVACAADQFCNGTGCKTVALSNVCENPRATVLVDSLAADVLAGEQLGAALLASCAPPPTVRYLPQSGGAIDAGSGRPLVGGSELLVTPGGSFGQALVDYFESNGISPVYDSSDGTVFSMSSRDAGALFSTPLSAVTPGHDYFLVELVRDPRNGSLALLVYGFFEAGTRAGAWYFTNQVLPARAGLADSWYVFEWTDADGDLAPTPGDSYLPLGSGR
ncbi:MAG: hypothetical protein ACYC8T_28170 [Myxococcaceae bacterium]